jgi:predicted PurR-regulated permease PerM
VLIIFLAIYIGAEPKLYHDGLMHLFPHRARNKAGEVLTEMATVLRKWLTTQLIAMAVIGTVTTVAMLLLNVKAAFALGFIAGILEFIPTVGPILSAIPAIAMGFVDGPDKALAVVAAYWGIQFLENNLLIPWLMRGGMDLPPALTLVAQALMTLVFGFLGILVAVPLTAAVLVPIKLLWVRDTIGDDLAVRDDEDEDEDHEALGGGRAAGKVGAQGPRKG